MGHIGQNTSTARALIVEAMEPRLLLSGGPLITEFMAANAGSLPDGDGGSSDWIEIHNPADAAVDLEGWYLTDRKNDPSTSIANWR